MARQSIQEPTRRTAIHLAAAIAISVFAAGADVRADEGRWGTPRADLDRFHGLYGTPGDPNGRNYFVAKARAPYGSDLKIPDGLLTIGAMWGDVAPWIMKSLEDARFLRPGWNAYNPDIHVRFETDGDGKATAMILEDFEYEPRTRLERIGDLPDNLK